ncbi:hypothetical protein PQX77_019632 [Marasmius sp. AFHP31]|nr:hypothetical protein PQX77_019632 [Marasmius sp. AFHP31]
MSTSNSATLPNEYLPLLKVGKVITYPIVTVMVTCIIYGFYVLLFGLCVYVLQRGDVHHRKLYTTWTSLLFLLSTSMVVVETVYELHESSVRYLFVKDHDDRGIKDNEAGHDNLKIALYILSYVVLILANAVADSILIHRCYVTWGSRRRVAVPLAILSCAISGI